MSLALIGASSAGVSILLERYAPEVSLGLVSNFTILFLLQFAVSRIWKIFIYPRFFSPLRHVPVAPGGSFFLGHTPIILKEPAGKPQSEWMTNVSNDGMIRYSLWWSDRVMLTNTKALAEVLVTRAYDFVKPPELRKALGRTLGVGILLAEGDEHKVQRKNLMPAFAFRHVKDLYSVFWAKGREMTDCLAKASAVPAGSQTQATAMDSEKASLDAPKHAPGVIDVGNWVSRATLDIIGQSGMGQDFHALQDENNKLNQTYRTMFNPGRVGRILQILGVFLPFWLVSNIPVKRNHEIIDATKYIKGLCRDLIAKKRATIAEKGRTEVDIISVALESGGFTDEELVNQMMTFLVAGHETTATAMIWGLFLLCQNPDVQAKLRKEVRSQLPGLDQDINAADIERCQYLRACCNEILRLWAPVSLTIRMAARDTSIEGQFIPKGTIVILSPWATNTSKELWGPDAKEFKPERWLNADGSANNKGGAESNYSFLTFLHGPRSCIGQRFAQAEFECLLAAWMMRFETAFEEGSPLAKGEMEIQGGVTAKPKGGLWVTLKEVDAEA